MSIAIRKTSEGSRMMTYGFNAVSRSAPIDVHAAGISNRVLSTFAHQLTEGKGDPVDANFWLPMAAEAYDLSKNIKDYIIVPNIPIILSDMPNTNGVAFSREELLKFNVKAGRMAYKTFKGKPGYVEHANANPKDAAGVILDVYVDLAAQGRGVLKVMELLAWDRYKNAALAEDIRTRKRTSYSMGAYFEGFTMSDGSKPSPIRIKEPLTHNARNELIYKIVHNIDGFETSSVGNPAFASATNDEVFE